MIYLATYLALGLPLVLALFFIAGRDEPAKRIISALVVLIVWPIWTVAIVREKWLMKRVATRCIWCGEAVTIDPNDSKTWEAHARACQNHPLRAEIERLESEKASETRWAKHYADTVEEYGNGFSKICGATDVCWDEGIESAVGDVLEKIQRLKNEASWLEPWKIKYEEANRDALDYKAKWEAEVEKSQRLTEAADHNGRMAQAEKAKRLNMEIAAAFHPRAWKLIQKCKPFVVVAEDEYYYLDAYQMIRHAEMLMDRWTPEDQRLYVEAITRWNEHYGEKYGYYPTPEAK